MAPNKLPSNRIPPVLPEAPAHHKGDVCIRPKKLPTVDHSVRYPLLGKVGSSDGLSLLRYRIAPAVVPSAIARRKADRLAGEHLGGLPRARRSGGADLSF